MSGNAYGKALERLRVARDEAAGITGRSVEERVGEARRIFDQNKSRYVTGPAARLPGIDSMQRAFSHVPTRKIPYQEVVEATGREAPGDGVIRAVMQVLAQHGMGLYVAIPVDAQAGWNLVYVNESEWTERERNNMCEAGMFYVSHEKNTRTKAGKKGKVSKRYLAVGGPQFIDLLKKGGVDAEVRNALIELALTVIPGAAGSYQDARSAISAIRGAYDANVKSLARTNRGKLSAATAFNTKTGEARNMRDTISFGDRGVDYNKYARRPDEPAKYRQDFGNSIYKVDDQGQCAPERMTHKSGSTLNYTNLRQGRRTHTSKRDAGAPYESCTLGSMIPDVDAGVSNVAAGRFGVAKGSDYADLFGRAGMGQNELTQTRNAYNTLLQATQAHNAGTAGGRDFRTQSKLTPYNVDGSLDREYLGALPGARVPSVRRATKGGFGAAGAAMDEDVM